MKLIVLALLALASAVGIILADRRRTRWQVANIAEGTSETGVRTYFADAAITNRNLLVKIGSDADHIALAGTADIGIGFAIDQADAAEDPVAVNLLGAAGGTVLGVAAAAITAGDQLVSAANGQVRTLPATTGTYYIVGRAIQAAAAQGDVLQIAPSFPIQRVVP